MSFSLFCTPLALPRARLTLLDAERGFTRLAEANGQGEFAIALVPPGTYKLRVESAGFGTKVLEGVEVRVGDVVTLNLTLAPSAVATEIVVSAEAAAVEVERTQQANTIEQRSITNLPINKRNFLDFAVLAPGVVSTQNLADDTSFRPIQTPNSGLLPRHRRVDGL